MYSLTSTNDSLMLLSTVLLLTFIENTNAITSIPLTESMLETTSTSTSILLTPLDSVNNKILLNVSRMNDMECSSVDIRNECDNFLKIENCTVITGYLLISLMPRPINASCDFAKYQFPRLREVTEFIIFYDVRRLTSITNMFPNLTVIRGQRLFLNYALSLTNMHDLKVLEFRSLVAIQRGHVLIGRNPQLCNLEKINWNRLTLSQGENHIFPENGDKCPKQSDPCQGCETPYCWSNRVCQKFENDNVLNLLQDIENCHELCLGGCLDTSPHTCMVCKSWRDHGTCVKQCPEDKYASKDYLRCYTREECIESKKLYIHKNYCVRTCPEGYKLNKVRRECELCPVKETCIKICNPPKADEPFWLFSLADVDSLRGCQILNGSVFILIRNRVQESEIFEGFAKVTEINGHLKIYKSPYLTNLNFLKNLRKIHGQPMENDHYSLILYNNQRLKELWPLQEDFEILRGGIYMHSNYKLCNRLIKSFTAKVIHDATKDSLQTSDQEVLCAPTKLSLNVQVLSHRSVKLSWPQQQTSNEVELIYRKVPNTDRTTFDVDSELDTAICDRIKWRRILKFRKELPRNSTHHFYIIHDLEPYTKYFCLVKTFGGEVGDNYEARSELLHFTTQTDIPGPPVMSAKSVTEDSITLTLNYENALDNRTINYYILHVNDMPEKQNLIDQRDYCKEPLTMYNEIVKYEEDYDDCCLRQHEEDDDKWFQNQMRDAFSCSRDRLEYCHKNVHDRNAIFIERHGTASAEMTYAIKSLERFRLYVIQAKACNRYGCGSHAMLSVRTQFSTFADNLYDLFGCRSENNNNNEYIIRFNEPQYPNSLITSYVIHLRREDDDNGYIHCLTRLQHEQNSYIFKVNLTRIYQQVAIRVNSLAGHVFTDWINLTHCTNSSTDRKLITKQLVSPSSKGWNVFFICFLVGAASTILWICYKHRYLHYIIDGRHYWRLNFTCRELFNWLRRRNDSLVLPEDRHVLVDTVQYHNNNRPEDDVIYSVN